MQESGSEEECSEESSSSPEEDAEFSANEEDGKINPKFITRREKKTYSANAYFLPHNLFVFITVMIVE